MHAPLLHFSFHPNNLFPTPIQTQTLAARSTRLDLKPVAIPFSALTFVRDFSWKRLNVGFGRRLLGGFASMAFSGGDGGSGKSDDSSGKGDDGEDGNASALVGSWSSPEDKENAAAILFGLWKLVTSIYCFWNNSSTLPTQDIVDQFAMILAIPFVLFLTPFWKNLIWVVWFCLLCYISMGIMVVALLVFVYFYCSRLLRRDSQEIASNPPADVECCICLSTWEGRPVWSSLPCNHWFHSPCIDSWIQINPTCPICKRDA